MNAILRDKTIQLRLDSSEGKDKVFEILKEKGVDIVSQLIAVQELPGRLWDVTFSSVEFKRKYWPAITNGTGYTASTYTSSATLVTVLHIPHELDDNVVRYILGRYGKVINGRYLTYREYPKVFNGIRQYLVEITRDIPSSLRLGNRNCWVRYNGQQRKCWNCQGKGHDARECRLTKCFKCQEMGHTASDCKAEVKCTTCNQFGHVDRKCPISFANMIKPAPSVWITGAAVVVQDRPRVSGPPRVPPGSKPTSSLSTPVRKVDSGSSSDDVNSMDTDPPPAVPVTHTVEPIVIPDSQPMEDLASDNDSQQDIFDINNVDALTSLSSVKANWSEPDTQPQEATTTNVPTIVISGDRATDSTEDASESPPERPPDTVTHETTGNPKDVPLPVDGSTPNVIHIPTTTFSQSLEVNPPIETRPKRKSSSQPDPCKRQERSGSCIRFPIEDPRDTIKMTQLFIEDEPWHSCHAKGCQEVFSKFKALKDHVNKMHPKRKTAKYGCPLKVCKTIKTTPQDWIRHIATSHPDFVQEHEMEYFDKYFLKDSHKGL